MRAGAFTLILVVVAACKDKPAAPPAQAPAPPTPPVPADAEPRPELARPSEPTAPREPLGEPLSIEDAAKIIPALATGKEILPLRQTTDKRQVHATWCLDGDGADEVARDVGKQMAAAGFRNLAIRGEAKKAGVQGEKNGFYLSMIVSASSAANCPAPKHYFASATVFRKP
jgi:hypothetical protein